MNSAKHKMPCNCSKSSFCLGWSSSVGSPFLGLWPKFGFILAFSMSIGNALSKLMICMPMSSYKPSAFTYFILNKNGFWRQDLRFYFVFFGFTIGNQDSLPLSFLVHCFTACIWCNIKQHSYKWSDYLPISVFVSVSFSRGYLILFFFPDNLETKKK